MATIQTFSSCPERIREIWTGEDPFIEDGVTTLLLRNIPRQYTVEELLAEVDAIFKTVAYNFVLLPWDQKKNANTGSCFINCINFPTACAYFCALSGYQFVTYPSKKRCQAVAARVQGLEMNLAYCALTSACSPIHSCRQMPLVFDGEGKKMALGQALIKHCPKETWADASQLAAKKVREEPESREYVSESGRPSMEVGHDDRGNERQEQRGGLGNQSDDDLASIPVPRFVKPCKGAEPRLQVGSGHESKVRWRAAPECHA